MKDFGAKKKLIGIVIRALIICALVASACAASTFAWYFSGKGVASYAPVYAADSLYIGAGHRDIQNDTFEDIRYLYFNEMDVKGDEYVDRVICIYGKSVPGYRIQLAYTTNNPFTYELYHATESTTASAGAVYNPTHQTPSEDYYYTATGNAIAGTYLNKAQNGTEATSGKHTETYGSYSTDYVQKNAEPIYWQTSATEVGGKNDFVNYYIVRVYKNGKESNDRETDVLCIAAKAFSLEQE